MQTQPGEIDGRRLLLEPILEELDRREPGVFTYEFRRLAPRGVEGFVIRAYETAGHATLTPHFRVTRANGTGYYTSSQIPPEDEPFCETSFSVSLYGGEPWQEGQPDDDDGDGDGQFLAGSNAADPEVAIRRLMNWASPPAPQPPPPIEESIVRSLGVISAGLRQRSLVAADALRDQPHANLYGSGIELEPNPDLEAQLSPESQAALSADLKQLNLGPLLWNFPIHHDGRLPLGVTVLLARYTAAGQLPRGRELWLRMSSPARRRDPQVLRLGLELLIGENHGHRWDRSRWMWDKRHAEAATDERRWGVASIPLEKLDIPQRPNQITALEKRLDAGNLAAGGRAALAILLQDAGRIEDAFTLYDIKLCESIQRILGAQEVFGVDCANQEQWPAYLRSQLLRCAPWLLRAEYRSELDLLVVKKKPRCGEFRLFTLPGQHHARKESVMLTADDREGTNLRLELRPTASNRLLPHRCWHRALEIDLIRFGVLPRDFLAE